MTLDLILINSSSLLKNVIIPVFDSAQMQRRCVGTLKKICSYSVNSIPYSSLNRTVNLIWINSGPNSGEWSISHWDRFTLDRSVIVGNIKRFDALKIPHGQVGEDWKFLFCAESTSPWSVLEYNTFCIQCHLKQLEDANFMYWRVFALVSDTNCTKFTMNLGFA
jgi:hypothetical protein